MLHPTVRMLTYEPRGFWEKSADPRCFFTHFTPQPQVCSKSCCACFSLWPILLWINYQFTNDQTHFTSQIYTEQRAKRKTLQDGDEAFIQNEIIRWNEIRHMVRRMYVSCCDCSKVELGFFVYNEYLTFSCNNNKAETENRVEVRL